MRRMGESDQKYPYHPGWVDRLTEAVDTLPLPASLIYLIIGTLMVSMFTAVQAWQGGYRQDGFLPWHIFVALQPLLPIGAIHYMDRVANSAWERFIRAFKGTDQELRSAHFRLTNAPAQGSLVSGLIGFGGSIVLFMFLQDLEASFNLVRVAPSALSQTVFLAYVLVAWFGFGTWVFHTIHQLRVINKLYTQNAQVDPSYPEPLYSLSAVTSRTAIIILLNSYGWFWVNVASIGNGLAELPSVLVTSIFFAGLGLLIFVWPLWGAHRLLEQVKSRALAENSNYHNRAVKELHHRVETKMIEGIDGWEKALSALQIERSQLERLPTWPWAPGSLRNFLLALIVPILVWFVQFGLERVLE